MGDNEKDQRQNISVELVTRNGVIEKLQMFAPGSDNKIEYNGLTLCKDGKYIHHQKYLDLSPNGIPKEISGFPHKNIASNKIIKSLTDFIVENNGENKFDIKVDGKEVSYKDLCDVLKKSDMLLEAKNIASAGYTSSFDDSPAARNKLTADVEKFGTPGAKAVFEEIKKLSKNGTVPISKDKEVYLQKLGNKYSDIEINISEYTIQIIQDRGYENHKPQGPNYDCFDVRLNDLKVAGEVGASVNSPAGKRGR